MTSLLERLQLDLRMIGEGEDKRSAGAELGRYRNLPVQIANQPLDEGEAYSFTGAGPAIPSG